jgi:NADP-dependent 3-hydroxy acid dehydrogenase YdfG
VSVIQPGLVDAGPSSQERRNDPKLSPDDVARTVMYAVSAPPGVDINEILVRPLGQRR